MTATVHSERFGNLYEQITSALDEFLATALHEKRISPQCALWFATLQKEFVTQYEGWPHYASTPIADYLQLLEDPGVHSDFRLAGHAFLHIAYDLPRCIAPTLAKTSAGWSRSDMRTAFLRPGTVFLASFLAYARSGGFGLIARVAGRFEPIKILAYWVLALRSAAWIHAEIIADSSSVGVFESKMATAMCVAATKALKRSWIFGVPDMNNSDHYLLAPVATTSLGDAAEISLLALIGAVAGTWITLAITHKRRDNEALAARIDTFGALVYQGMCRVTSPEGEALLMR